MRRKPKKDSMLRDTGELEFAIRYAISNYCEDNLISVREALLDANEIIKKLSKEIQKLEKEHEEALEIQTPDWKRGDDEI